MAIRATPASHSAMFNGPTRSALLCSIRVEPFADGRLDQRRVGLAARRLHDLADEEADRLRLAGPVVGDGRRVGRQRPRRRPPPSDAAVRDLAEAPGRDDRRRRPRPIVACASRTSRPCAREIDPDADRLDDRAELRAATTVTGSLVGVAQAQVLAGDPVRDAASRSSAGTAASVASKSAAASGSATRTAAS